MEIFKIKETWDGPCAATKNEISVDCGAGSCKITGKYGSFTQGPVEASGKFYLDAMYASTLYIAPVAKQGFHADQPRQEIKVGPEKHAIFFTFSDGEKQTVSDGTAFGPEVENRPSALEELKYKVDEIYTMMQAFMSQFG